MIDALCSWQINDYNYLLKLKNRLPHALLLHGAQSLASNKLAHAFIQSLLCGNPDINGSYCGVCNSCSLYGLNSHPDYYSLNLNEDEKTISIAQVRNVTEFLSISTHLGRYKIIFVEDAGLLNINSANALLKILEGPPIYALFILLSDNIGQLLPTIISRCQKYKLSVPDSDYVADNIEISEEQFGLLIKVLSKPSVDNIYEFTSTLEAKNMTFILEFLTKWLSDLLSFKLAGVINYFSQYESDFKQLIEKQNIDKAFYLQDKLSFLLEWAKHPLNYKLQIENILFQYQQIFVK
jgi:DNA polymerase-3 subunit delta'